MKFNMEIEQGENGWIRGFDGHDALRKVVVCKSWNDVIEELGAHFGWYINDKRSKAK